VAVGKACDAILVPHVSALAEKSQQLMGANVLLPPQKQHLIEFLTCVANAVDDVAQKTSFVSSMLTTSTSYLQSPEFAELSGSVEGLLKMMGIANATEATVLDANHVNATSTAYSNLFSAMNQILSVGKRCYESGSVNKVYRDDSAAELQRLEGQIRYAGVVDCGGRG
jgi:hypothetical protein